MAVLLPLLRLWLLLLNVYGTFKGLKRSSFACAVSRRGRALAAGGKQQNASVRASQLRKRELKGCLAMWVVWATFSLLERPLDHTLGLLTPFYNEVKCVILIFLLVSRSHGAEAIFLHLIHPSVRPYVPAVDHTLATLHSIFDLLSLVVSLPWEIVSSHWHNWKSNWGSILGFHWNRDTQPIEALCREDRESLNGQTLCRHQHSHEIQGANVRKLKSQVQVIPQEIKDAQNRVGIQTRSRATKNKPSVQPGSDPIPESVGLRTRKRVLEHSTGVSLDLWPQQPGPRSTGGHHLDPAVIPQLARDSPTQHELPTQTVFRSPPAYTSTATHKASIHTHSLTHEIWYPPSHASRSTPLGIDDTGGRRTPSPVSVYPPLPAAYPFTPRPRDHNFHPPPPPRIVTPPNLVTPTPRRVSTGVLALETLDAFEGIDQFAEQRPNLISVKSSNDAGAQPPGEPPPGGEGQLSHNHVHRNMVKKDDFFGDALKPSIQKADMDVDMRVNGNDNADAAALLNSTRGKGGLSAKGKAKANSNREITTTVRITGSLAPVRRSARIRNGDNDDPGRVRTAGVIEPDEFGSALPTTAPGSAFGEGKGGGSRIKVVAVTATTREPGRKKPLARTKPLEKPKVDRGPVRGESSDEENGRKRRKVESRVDDRAAAEDAGGIKVSNFVDGKQANERVMGRKGGGATTRTAGLTDIVRDGDSEAKVTRGSMKPPLNMKKRDGNRKSTRS